MQDTAAILPFTPRTAEEQRGQSNGHKWRDTNSPNILAAAFYLECWEQAADETRQRADLQGNTAKICVETEKLATHFINAMIGDLKTRSDGTENSKSRDIANAMETMVDKRFPNGTQEQRTAQKYAM